MLIIMTRPVFRKLELSDRGWVQELIREDKSIGCEYTFASMYLWQDIYKTTYAKINHCLIRRSGEDDQSIIYHYPIGRPENRKIAVRSLLKEARDKKKTLALYGLSDVTLEELKSIRGEYGFQYESVRNNQNYILNTGRIADLNEKILRDKRRFTNRFMENNDWSYEKLTKDLAYLCEVMNDEWYLTQQQSIEKAQEVSVTREAIRHFEELGLSGWVLKSDKRVVAFMIGEQLQEDMYVIHFLKAYREVYGSYQMILHLSAREIAAQYRYINMEEDMGERGLRQAKSSWAPEYLSAYYNASIPLRTKSII